MSDTGSVLSEGPKRNVAAARLVKGSGTCYKSTNYYINKLQYEVPIDHRTSDDVTIDVTVRVVLGKVSTTKPKSIYDGVWLDPKTPIAVYLVGGPGSDNPPMANPALNEFYLKKGFQILYMDYRGTGDSYLLRADNLTPLGRGTSSNNAPHGSTKQPLRLLNLEPQLQADLLAKFRQDNIVRDLEAVRKSLCRCGVASATKWTLIGQSYGGWVAFTYLSFYPEGLHMVLLTGGIPPVGQSINTVYRHTYKKTIETCDKFYGEYGRHKGSVRRIMEFIAKDKPIKMPGGGNLTVARFLCLGRTLGTAGGEAKVDNALNMCIGDLDNPNLKTFSYKTLEEIESWLRFEERPLYAILHEPIYMDGPQQAKWSAHDIGKELPRYWWMRNDDCKKVFLGEAEDAPFRKEKLEDEPIAMVAEHVLQCHYDDFQSLGFLKEAAEILATKSDWAPLYDEAQLAQNQVPISSLSYENDMFVVWVLSKITANMTANIKFILDEKLMHTAVKDMPDEVLGRLWKGLIDAIEDLLTRKLADDEREDARLLIPALVDSKKPNPN